MCNFVNVAEAAPYGFIIDTPEVRAIVAAAERAIAATPENEERIEALKPAFARLLKAEGWLPATFAAPDMASGMGDGIGQYALYRAEDGELCLFSLVVPAGAATPVHDHLAWGLIGLYRGRQDETIYRRVDDGAVAGHAELQVAARQELDAGGMYPLLPPDGDIHRVRTISEGASVSIHLLANDTACVWRHRFDPDAGTVQPFRSGYSNAPCRPEG